MATQDFLDDLRSSLNTSLNQISVPVGQALASQIPVGSTTAAAGGPYSAMYVFGDSLSDAGNVSLATGGLVPVSPPYADRSFSNGPVWAVDLASALGLPALQPSLAGGTDFAFGGAETGRTPEHTPNGTDLTSQFSQFTAQVASPQSGALYAIWIGSNDVLDIANDASLTQAQQQADVAAAVNNEVSVIDQLAARGARNLLVLNVPDLGKTPDEIGRGATAAATASSLASLYDNELASALQPLQASGSVKVNLVDTYSLLDQLVANPGAVGLSNATDPVWTGNVSSSSGTLNATGAAQNQYVFFDSLHPTAQTHSLLASDIASQLTGTAGQGNGSADFAKQGNDFNGDKRSDILWQNADASVSIWEMNGTSIINGGLVTWFAELAREGQRRFQRRRSLRHPMAERRWLGLHLGDEWHVGHQWGFGERRVVWVARQSHSRLQWRWPLRHPLAERQRRRLHLGDERDVDHRRWAGHQRFAELACDRYR
jgi:phospholipase/lecithinase/hemolysin